MKKENLQSVENNAKMPNNYEENNQIIEENEQFNKNVEPNSKSVEKKESKLNELKKVWGNPKALIFLAGNIILWVACLFFSIMTYKAFILEKTTATISIIMIVVFSILVAIMLSLFIMSLVFFVNNNKNVEANGSFKEMQ